MRLRRTDGELAPGAAMLRFELPGERKAGPHLGSPVRMTIGPSGQDQRSLSGDLRSLFPGVLCEPLPRAFRKQRSELMGIEVGSNAGAQSAGGYIEIGPDLKLRVIKVGMEVGNRKFRRVPTAASSGAFRQDLGRVQLRDLEVPIAYVGRAIYPAFPRFVHPPMT